MNFGNVSTAMITPFDNKGNVDFQKLSTLIDYLLKNGTDSLNCIARGRLKYLLM